MYVSKERERRLGSIRFIQKITKPPLSTEKNAIPLSYVGPVHAQIQFRSPPIQIAKTPRKKGVIAFDESQVYRVPVPSTRTTISLLTDAQPMTVALRQPKIVITPKRRERASGDGPRALLFTEDLLIRMPSLHSPVVERESPMRMIPADLDGGDPYRGGGLVSVPIQKAIKEEVAPRPEQAEAPTHKKEERGWAFYAVLVVFALLLLRLLLV